MMKRFRASEAPQCSAGHCDAVSCMRASGRSIGAASARAASGHTHSDAASMQSESAQAGSSMRPRALTLLRTVSIMLCALLLMSAQDKAPAQFQYGGEFVGGSAKASSILTGIRFGKQKKATRMVLDFESYDAEAGERGFAGGHPKYTISYAEYPYRLIARFEGLHFASDAKVQSSPALPFSVVTPEDGTVKEMQIFLPGPCEFKVIEVDGPAKLAIDVLPVSRDVPDIYTVQVTNALTAEDAYGLIEQGNFPDDFRPQAIVMGDVVVLEQVFSSLEQASAMDAELRKMGYASVINSRRGDELPQH